MSEELQYAAGKEVYIDASRYGRTIVHKGVVQKIRKNGWIDVSVGNGTMTFTPMGRQVSSDKWNKAQIIDKARYERSLAESNKQKRYEQLRQTVKEVDDATTPRNIADKTRAITQIKLLLKQVEEL